MAATNITWVAPTSVALTTTGGSATNGSAIAAGTDLDVRAAGNAALLTYADFLLKCQWATITGIAAGTIVADLFLVPKLDGTNLPQLDLTSGASYIPSTFRVGSFVAAKVATAATDTYFALVDVVLKPSLYTAYILNRSGQTISANWALTAYVENLQGV